MQGPESSYVAVDQLQIGLYVYLDMKWFEHPFAFNNFKIKDEEQIRTIRSLGIKKIRYDPARSDLKSPPNAAQQTPDDEKAEEPVAELIAARRFIETRMRDANYDA